MAGKNSVKAASAPASEITDSRFTAMYTDPRFSQLSKKKSKLKLDSRFKEFATDDRYGDAPAVDMRGRKTAGGNRLQRFFEVDEAEAEAGVARPAPAPPVADEEPDADEYGYTESEEEVVDVELPETYAGTLPDATNRLAVTDLAWESTSADDVYVVLSSFVPVGERVESVVVYESDFGRAALAIEEQRGPVIVDPETLKVVPIRQSRALEDAVLDPMLNQRARNKIAEARASQGGIDEKPDPAFVRRYEQQRRRYFFAVATFSSPSAALSAYVQCDGLDLGPAEVSLSFVPDGVELENYQADGAGARTIKSSCSKMPEVYYTDTDAGKSGATSLTAPKLSWGTDADTARGRLLSRRFTAEQIEEMDFNDFLAPPSDDEYSEADENAAARGAEAGATYAQLVAAATERASDAASRKKTASIGVMIDGSDAEDLESDEGSVVCDTGADDAAAGVSSVADAGARLLAARVKRLHAEAETPWEATRRRRAEKQAAREAEKAAASAATAAAAPQRDAARREAAKAYMVDGAVRIEAGQALDDAEMQAAAQDPRFADIFDGSKAAFAVDRNAPAFTTDAAAAERVAALRYGVDLTAADDDQHVGDLTNAADERAAAARAAQRALAKERAKREARGKATPRNKRHKGDDRIHRRRRNK